MQIFEYIQFLNNNSRPYIFVNTAVNRTKVPINGVNTRIIRTKVQINCLNTRNIITRVLTNLFNIQNCENYTEYCNILHKFCNNFGLCTYLYHYPSGPCWRNLPINNQTKLWMVTQKTFQGKSIKGTVLIRYIVTHNKHNANQCLFVVAFLYLYLYNFTSLT